MTALLPRRRLGSSDLMVSPIGLGCWQFSKGQGISGKYWPILADDEIEHIVRVSLEGGVNWFDTAEAYGQGRSERELAAALKKLGKTSEDVIIATKWMPTLRSAKSILDTVDTRLENLGGFRIDLFQIHQPTSFSPVKAQMRAMAELIKERKIRYVGVSNFSARKMAAAHEALAESGLALVSNQMHYSLLNRQIETDGVLDEAKKRGISIIAYSPLEQGLLTGKFHDHPDSIRKRPGPRKYLSLFRPEGMAKSRPVVRAVREIAEKRGVTAAQVALNWIIKFNGDLVVAIPGATKAGQAEDNAGAINFELTREELDRLDAVSARFKK